MRFQRKYSNELPLPSVPAGLFFAPVPLAEYAVKASYPVWIENQFQLFLPFLTLACMSLDILNPLYFNRCSQRTI
ncbi:MAG: hypothetical protein D3924_12650 [Candidatus Electrothrix sp. AR4]|nr:hypothetical protein [Candidatus Electrothrix sp. AR4]